MITARTRVARARRAYERACEALSTGVTPKRVARFLAAGDAQCAAVDAAVRAENPAWDAWCAANGAGVEP